MIQIVTSVYVPANGTRSGWRVHIPTEAKKRISGGKWQVTCLSLSLRYCGIMNRRTSQATYRASCNDGWPTLQAIRLYEETIPPHTGLFGVSMDDTCPACIAHVTRRV